MRGAPDVSVCFKEQGVATVCHSASLRQQKNMENKSATKHERFWSKKPEKWLKPVWKWSDSTLTLVCYREIPEACWILPRNTRIREDFSQTKRRCVEFKKHGDDTEARFGEGCGAVRRRRDGAFALDQTHADGSVGTGPAPGAGHLLHLYVR